MQAGSGRYAGPGWMPDDHDPVSVDNSFEDLKQQISDLRGMIVRLEQRLGTEQEGTE